jgi:radical SAM protein with 4Fe4S-binding SPASM domain
MPFAEAKKSVDFLESLGIQVFVMHGGEPTIYHSILPLIEYAHSKNMRTWIITNGNKIADPEFGQAVVDAGLEGGCISIDGFDEAEHEFITRVKGSFAKTIQAIRNSTRYSWPFYPMITVGRHNIKNIWSCIEKLIDLGCQTIYINYGVPNIVREMDTSADVSPGLLAKLSEELFLAQSKLGVTFIFNREKNKIPLCEFNFDLLNKMFDDKVIGVGCGAAQGNTIVIEPGGSLLGCSHWVNHQLLNIYKNYETLELLTPKEFWQEWSNGKSLNFRHTLKRYYPYEKCEECDWRKSGKCFGGCKTWQSAEVMPKLLEYELRSSCHFEEPATRNP